MGSVNKLNLAISKESNPNYLAKIVKVEKFTKHPNPKTERLKLAHVEGYTIAVGIDTEPGYFIYFPVECQISDWYLKANNLYRIKEMNINPEMKSGFFEEKGRVKCIKLQSFASEGLLMPADTLFLALNGCITNDDLKYEFENIEFDTVNDQLLVKKYVIETRNRGSNLGGKIKSAKYDDQIAEGQFRFHGDTEQLKKNLFKFQTDTLIHISHKFHGTSAIFCNLLVKRKLPFFQKVLKLIGGQIPTVEYKTFCSSRKVVKDPELNKGLTQGFYDSDIWNVALEVIKPYLQKGMSIYAEIVGYLPTGGLIQRDYDYGCVYEPNVYDYSNMNPQQMYDKNLFKIYIYRITYTNIDGKVFEMSAKNLQQYCINKGLQPIVEDFYGTVYDFVDCHGEYAQFSNQPYEEYFLQLLQDRYLERECGWCKNKVPAEGIVIRIDKPEFEAYKLKSISFLEKESKMLDEGVEDIESQ